MSFARWLGPVNRTTFVVSGLCLGDFLIVIPEPDVFAPLFAELEDGFVLAVATCGSVP